MAWPKQLASSCSDVSDNFVHDSLDTGTRNIRVLQIMHGSEKSVIQCRLKSQLLTDGGHVCLSYMWGDQETSHWIIINGYKHPVRENLWHFLLAARRMRIVKWLWIDAISINQNKIEERNHQVELMSEIYRLAQHVIVWPGDYKEGTTKVIYSTFEKVKMRLCGCLSLSILYSQLRGLYQDPGSEYWQRLWVVQEIILAKHLYILHEPFLIRWDETFDRAWGQLLQNPKLSHLTSFYTVQLRTILAMRSRFFGINDQDQAASLTPAILRLPIHRGCADIRDRWYGILGLIPAAASFAVDYDVTPAELFLNIIQHFHSKDALPVNLWQLCNILTVYFSLRAYRLCQSCAKDHPKVVQTEGGDFAGIEQGLREGPSFITVIQEAEAPSWSFSLDGPEPPDCARCLASYRKPHRELQPFEYSSLVRIAPTQMWCIPTGVTSSGMAH